MTPWLYTQTFDEYYDFDKELFALPDDGRTSIDMQLTFNTETRKCCYSLYLKNDSGETVEWPRLNYIPWAMGLELLAADGIEIPAELIGETA
jgi:hypothetical protein